jgi:hypothetical protein
VFAGDAVAGEGSKVVIKTGAIYKRSKLNKIETKGIPGSIWL